MKGGERVSAEGFFTGREGIKPAVSVRPSQTA